MRSAHGAGGADALAQPVGDALGPVVQDGGQAGDGDAVRDAVGADHGQRLARQGTAGDQQRPGRAGGDPGDAEPVGPQAVALFAWLCLRRMKSLAVSTATAASRQ